MITKTLLVVSAFLLFSPVTKANKTEYSKYLTIAGLEQSEIVDLGVGKMGNLDKFPIVAPKFYMFSGFQDSPIGDIVNIGKLVWDIITYNKAVANMQTDMATALPKGVSDWSAMLGWMSESKAYRIAYKNKLGSNVVDFTYRVLFTHSGSFNGKGKYLTAITIIPANLTVLWGFQFNAKASVPTVLNVGTLEDPVAAARMFLRWGVKSVLSANEITKTYTVQGDGVFADTSSK